MSSTAITAVPPRNRSERALDRVLLWNHYVVPLYYAPFERIAVWDVFGRPAQPPAYGLGVPVTWWFDAAKARRIGRF